MDVFSEGKGHRLVTTLTLGNAAPVGLATSAVGDLYVADAAQQVIDVFKSGASKPTEVIGIPPSEGSPNYVAVDSAGDVAAITSYYILLFPPGSATPCVTLKMQDSLSEPLGNASFQPDGQLLVSLPNVSGAITKVVGGCKAAKITVVPRGVVAPIDIKVDTSSNIDVLDARPSGTQTIDVFKPGHKQPAQLVPLEAGTGYIPLGFGFEGGTNAWVLEHCGSGCQEVQEFAFPQGGKPVSTIKLPISNSRAYGIATSDLPWLH